MGCKVTLFFLLGFTYPFRNEIPKVRKIKVIKIRKKEERRRIRKGFDLFYGNKKRHTHCLHYIPPFLIHSFFRYLLFVYPANAKKVLKESILLRFLCWLGHRWRKANRRIEKNCFFARIRLRFIQCALPLSFIWGWMKDLIE